MNRIDILASNVKFIWTVGGLDDFLPAKIPNLDSYFIFILSNRVYPEFLFHE